MELGEILTAIYSLMKIGKDPIQIQLEVITLISRPTNIGKFHLPENFKKLSPSLSIEISFLFEFCRYHSDGSASLRYGLIQNCSGYPSTLVYDRFLLSRNSFS